MAQKDLREIFMRLIVSVVPYKSVTWNIKDAMLF